MATSLDADPLLSAVPELRGFKVLPPAILYDRIGVGGMGAVYRGKHYNLEVEVAVKCLKASLSQAGGQGILRFQREAKLAASIIHPNLIHIYDVANASGVHYLVMEFVAGETVTQRIRRKGPLGEGEAVAIALGAANGLAAAHAKKIVHRDVKPDNILISHEGVVKLADLGIARAMDNEEFLTMTTGQIGTPQYMPPEQWTDASKVAPAADVWALGATLYYLLTGDNAIQATTQGECAHKICNFDFPSVAEVRPDLDARLLALIQGMTQREQGARPADAAEVARRLREVAGVLPTELAFEPQPKRASQAHLKTPPPTSVIAEIRSGFATAPGIRPAPVSTTVIEDEPAPRGLYEPPSSDWRPTPTHAGDTKPNSGAPAKLARWAGAAAALLALGGAAAWWSQRGDGGPGNGVAAPGQDAKQTAAAEPGSVAGPKIIPEGGANQGTVYTNSLRYTLGGNVLRPQHEYFSIQIDGESVPGRLDGDRFEVDLDLEPNALTTVEILHESAMVEVEIQHDDRAPVIEINAPTESSRLLREGRVEVAVALDEDHVAGVQIDGQPAEWDGSLWRQSILLQREGSNRVEVTANDLAGNAASYDFEVVLDSTGPALEDYEQADLAIYPGDTVPVALTFGEPVVRVTGPSGDLALGSDGTSAQLRVDAPPSVGVFSVSLTSADRAGNESRHELSLLVVERPPRPVIALLDDALTEASTYTQSLEFPLSGRVSDAATGGLQVVTESGPRELSLGADGRFAASVALQGNTSNRIEIRHGDAEPLTFEVIQDSINPVVEVVSPPGLLKTTEQEIQVVVRASDPHLEKVTLENVPMEKDAQGRWTGKVSLDSDRTESFEVFALDAAGNSATRYVQVLRDRTGPRLLSTAPTNGMEVPRGPLALSLAFDERIASLKANGVALEDPSSPIKVVIPAPDERATTIDVRLECTDELGNRSEFRLSYALPEFVEVVVPEPEPEIGPEPEVEPEPAPKPNPGPAVDAKLAADGFRPSGVERNDLGYPRLIVHRDTGGKLMAVPFVSGERPRFYVWTREVSKSEYKGSGSSREPANRVSGQESNRWCEDRGLSLPKVADWQYLMDKKPIGVSGLADKTREWLRFTSSPVENVWPYVAKPDGSIGKTTWKFSSKTLGFRAVYYPR